MPIPPETGEAGVCREFVERLIESYGRSGMFEILDFDAGLCSLATADAVDAHGYGYVFGLKGNQPELYEQAPEAQTDWESRNGTRMRRSLWRTPEMRG